MGSFYHSFLMRVPDQESVVRFFRDQGRDAFISPRTKGVVVAYDRECGYQDMGEIEELGREVSKVLDAPVLSVLNHDDDFLVIRLFVGGEVRASYDSFIDAVTPSLMIGWHFKQPFMIPFLFFALALPWTVFQMLRHTLVNWLMAWPYWSACGYGDIASGDPSIDDVVQI